MRFFLLVAFFCLTPCLCPAQERVRTIDTILSRLSREDAFSGNVLISERGRIIYEKSFGSAGAGGRRPLTADTLFLVGSVAKTFTAAAVFILKERGALALDDSVTKYLPELPYRNVTLRHLLAHTSGIPEYQSDEIIKEIAGKGVDNAGLVKVFARLASASRFEPGSRWEYSNTNYIILALLVERVSGKYTPTALMRILNGEPYRLDLKPLATAMGREYNRRGHEAMLKLFRDLKGNEDYSLSEDDLNELGLRLLYDRKDAGAAVEVLKLNAEQFPRSFNVWDSLGEAYYQSGNREEAVRNYEKSLQLNPDNIDGKRMLERIRNEQKQQ